MEKINQFISFVIVADNDAEYINDFITSLSLTSKERITDYEIIIIDNSSTDNTNAIVDNLCDNDGIENIIYFKLAYKVPYDIASWAGVENSIGDNVLLVDPRQDSISILDKILVKIDSGADLIYVENARNSKDTFLYRMFSGLFHFTYKVIYGSGIKNDSSSFKVLSRTLINHVAKNQSSDYKVANLSAFSGFKTDKITYEYDSAKREKA